MPAKRRRSLTPPCRRPRPTATTSSPNSANRRPTLLSDDVFAFLFYFCLVFFLTPASFPNSIPPAFFLLRAFMFFLSYQKTVCPRACRCWKPHFRANHVLRRFIFIVLAPPTLPALLRVGTSRRFLSQACMVRDSRREATSESSSFCPRRIWEDQTALTHSLTEGSETTAGAMAREGGRKVGNL